MTEIEGELEHYITARPLGWYDIRVIAELF